MKIIAMILLLSSSAFAGELVDMSKIIALESSGDPNAYNPTSQAIGLAQITPICLQDWNDYHPHEQYIKEDLYDAAINLKIAHWYLYERIVQLLKHYHQAITTENILVSYNVGILYVIKSKPLPTETKNYLKKYLDIEK